ncbi:amino acid ABC transporter ATP-binding/permease protein [Novosphingobium album (ex Liu et al. 2023)]|uniref:ATP-binding cassette domain-containing protein n=1 Tax=Novosphingobium album (ex Liu et al. 2023) TaxID=3031130 RepID=A0ABT5WVZ7_9SPHN|nr:ATP-binding cassette domain-containing protein [Novosphingobium album (ex Liu et al. 2023)]MDE8654049.1 ATP-binding cassette domain-containing protein [Novosphingobium album (ex Liu et al. 2023)]
MTAPLDLLRPGAAIRRLLRLAALSASTAALSAILLLGISGWFLTAAAAAGTAGVLAVQAFNYLIPSAAIRLLAILRTVTRYGERILSHRAALMAMADLRGRLFARLAAQDTRVAPNLSAGDASGRLIGDIDALEDLIVRQPTRPASLIAALTGVGLAALAGWLAALLLAVMLAALPFLLRALAARLTRAPAHEAAEALGELRRRYIDFAAARAEIAAYGLIDTVLADLAGPAARLDRARARLFRGEGAIAGFLACYGALAAAVVMASARGEPPFVALALLAASSAVEALAAISRTAFRQASVEEGLRRLAVLLDLPGDLRTAPVVVPGSVALRFGPVELAPGGRIALTGASGSGKTMVLEALAGLRAGDLPIAVGGTPLAGCDADALRTRFALAPQDAPMLAGSIADNLRLARPGVDEAAMWHALETAALAERVRRAPAGLDTVLGEEGGILSGGERKRLSLARALLAGRPWLLLDEPTEGLDAATERGLVANLRDWLDRTGTGLVLVSHRPHPMVLARERLDVAELVRL